MTQSVLETSGLRKSFAGILALDGVSVAIGEGELVGIIGANGAGKTTFVNVVTGYVKPDAGAIRFMGREISRLSPREITRLGVARSFQIPQLFLELSVLDNALIALAVAAGYERVFLRPLKRPQALEQARALLARFKLDRYADYRCATLPQGARKLLDIAMATGGHPKLVLLDEPTSGVSKDEKFALMDTLLAPLAQSGAGVMFIEHDMEIVERYAHRVIAFHEGRVLADGEPKSVLADDKVRAFVTGTPANARTRDERRFDAIA